MCSPPAAQQPAVPHVSMAVLQCTRAEFSGVQTLQQSGVRVPSPTEASLQDAPRAQVSHHHQLQAAPRSCFSEQCLSQIATCPFSGNVPPGATGCPSLQSQHDFCLKSPTYTFMHALGCEQRCCGHRPQRSTAAHQLLLPPKVSSVGHTHTVVGYDTAWPQLLLTGHQQPQLEPLKTCLGCPKDVQEVRAVRVGKGLNCHGDFHTSRADTTVSPSPLRSTHRAPSAFLEVFSAAGFKAREANPLLAVCARLVS